MERSVALQTQGIEWIKLGGYVDYTADAPGENATLEALVRYKNSGVDMSRVTLSSDAFGSFPVFDDKGNLVYYGVGMPDNVINELRMLIQHFHWSIEQAFRLVTTNTAAVLALPHKGRLAVGNDADVLVLDAKTLAVQYVFARGNALKTPSWTASGMFPGS
jgi:beta-aspartyl-dipeptidase (metallo-type)